MLPRSLFPEAEETTWLYSIYRGQKVSGEERVIDSNDRIQKRIEEFNAQLEEEKSRIRQDELMELLDNLEPDEEGNYYLPRDEEGNFTIPCDRWGEPLVVVNEEGMLLPMDSVEEEEHIGEDDYVPEDVEPEVDPHEQAEAILGSARLDAEEILEDARQQAEALRENARHEGYDEGFAQGQAQAAAEAQQAKEEYDRQLQELQREFSEREQGMEHELVDVISDVVSRVFLAEMSDDREVMLHLVDQALSHAENSREFLIRINEAGYEFLNENRDKLQEKVGAGIQLELIKDPLMEEGACMIETDGGVFDVSLDTQMKNLIRRIRSLSI